MITYQQFLSRKRYQRVAAVLLPALRLLKFNPNHAPAGTSEGGQFTGNGWSSIGGDTHFLSKKAEGTLFDEERSIRDAKVEHGRVIDPDSGELLWSHTDNKETAIDLPPRVEELMVKWRGKVFTHNHPGGKSLSENDVLTARNFDWKAVRAVSPGGSWYMISRTEDYWPPDFSSRVNDMAKGLRNEWQRDIDNSSRDILAAQSEFHDELWKRVEKEFDGAVKYTKHER